MMDLRVIPFGHGAGKLLTLECFIPAICLSPLQQQAPGEIDECPHQNLAPKVEPTSTIIRKAMAKNFILLKAWGMVNKDSIQWKLAKAIAKQVVVMKLLRLNDAFNKRCCIFYTLKWFMVYIASNYQTLKIQISRIMKLEKTTFRQSKSLTLSQANSSPLQIWCNRFTFALLHIV